MSIGTLLKKYRTEKGYSRKEMAEKMGVSYSAYSNYENNNRDPNIDILRKLSKILDISIDELLGFSIKRGHGKVYDNRSGKFEDYEGLYFDVLEDEPRTIAAHHDGEDWTEEELKEIEEFKKFVKMKRQEKE